MGLGGWFVLKGDPPLLWRLPLADTIVGRLQNTSYRVGDGGTTQLWSQPPDSYRGEHPTHPPDASCRVVVKFYTVLMLFGR